MLILYDIAMKRGIIMGRYNRYYRSRSRGMGFSIFIIVIILAVATGYAGTKFIVYPYLLDNNPKTEDSANPSDTDGTSTGPGIDAISSMPSIIIDQQNIKDNNTSNPAVETGNSVVNPNTPVAGVTTPVEKGPFSVQFGSFATKEGAETLSNQLTEKGIYSYIYESGGSHKVLGLPYAEKVKAQEAAAIVSSAVADVFVVDIALLLQ